MLKKTLPLVIFSFLSFHHSHAQLFSKKKNKSKSEVSDTKPKPDKNGIKKYSDVIKEGSKTDDGLFKVHLVGDDHYYEIPFKMLEKEMLWVSRISQLPNNLGGGYVNAGSKSNEQVVEWQRYKNKILLRVKSYSNIADSSKAISKSVKVNNFEPILFAFEIKAFSPDSTAAVIQVDPLFTTDVVAISGMSSWLRKRYKVKKLDQSRSFINSIKSFPENVEVKQDLTYDASEPPSFAATGTISLQMNQSMILLPENPMTPRLNDPRVGFFTVSQIDYGSPELKADEKQYIRRWRMEPKDAEAYARGELVEPIKPIVYYLDPGTPENLRKYIKQGIEDWQKPFETAGFKNAIIAKDAPTPEEDPEFSPEDIRYSVVRYVASTTRNAVGPSVSDPRSGEIIESDIIWYHNHLRSYRNRYLLETGAANPSARTLDTPEEEMGEMMRMVIAHEVGHALGFPHNMAASYAYPVDSLRNGEFTQKNGIAASIMDYARYNYVAQPGDENIRFVRQMGPYDHYAVNWGYRWLPNVTDPTQEKGVLDTWVLEKGNDPKFRYGKQSNRFDPQSQTECIGDDTIKASTYGISNLKYVLPNLPSWTSDKTNNYDDLDELYGELIGVYNRYVGHVARNIGGVFETIKTPSQKGSVYAPISAKEQQESMVWLQKNVFDTPKWLIDTSVLQNIDHSSYFENLRRVQSRQLNQLMGIETLGRLINTETLDGEQYGAYQMLSDLRKGIWKEAYQNKSVDLYRRNLQNTYLERLTELLLDEHSASYNVETSDVKALAYGELKALQSTLKRAKNGNINAMTKYHYENTIAKIDSALDE
ncbi:zinc-dependent metalloprotease [Flagellimonas zhangzhouensis]|uniref:Zinc-dependent metalloprotease n=1 Tax=Flagellimonas zhangzhouensis TaxID=1073328 RepID=A0A1H2XUA0_9FLAO|nr:zinc-dependent metalloprotease [Allomuricauda zhangzhouensis]SDQ91818.1 protein of unknown function [Allomuricauda zhangzhouensis]SDW96532.1 protein of unknown function [Allomuricauda zhangzhouensis]